MLSWSTSRATASFVGRFERREGDVIGLLECVGGPSHCSCDRDEDRGAFEPYDVVRYFHDGCVI